MNVVALDISSAGTGVAVGDASSPPRCSTFRPSGQTRGAKGQRFQSWLRDLILLERPGLVAFEAPLMRNAKNNNPDALFMLVGLAFLTETVAHGRTEFEAVPVQTARKAFVGHGFPKDPKAAVMAQCAALGWDHHADDNQADACAVWCWAHLHRGNARAMHKLLSAQRLMGMGARK